MAIVSSSHDAILSTDLEMRILSWNYGAEHLYGYSTDEAIGRKVTMLLPSNRRTEKVEIFEKISRSLAVAPYETVRLHKNDARLDVQLTVLLPFGLSNSAIICPKIDVSSHAAMAFSLDLHELATNASKYGALSMPGGSVDVTGACGPAS